MKNEYLNTKEAADFLRISKSTLNKLSRPGNPVIPVSKIGGKIKLYSIKDLNAFVQQNKAA